MSDEKIKVANPEDGFTFGPCAVCGKDLGSSCRRWENKQVCSEDRDCYDHIASIDPYGNRTLRDYFAAEAMNGMLLVGFQPLEDEKLSEALAGAAYEVADAMMLARRKS